ncbi:MAG: hypothetical protein ABIQ81_06295 [Novosphingobium sp.]
MNKFAPLALLATIALFSVAPAALHAETLQSARAATEAGAPVNVTAGKSLYSASGTRLAAVYRVSADGRIQVILDGKLVTVPNATLSDVNGKITTSLTKSELLRTAR